MENRDMYSHHPRRYSRSPRSSPEQNSHIDFIEPEHFRFDSSIYHTPFRHSWEIPEILERCSSTETDEEVRQIIGSAEPSQEVTAAARAAQGLHALTQAKREGEENKMFRSHANTTPLYYDPARECLRSRREGIPRTGAFMPFVTNDGAQVSYKSSAPMPYPYSTRHESPPWNRRRQSRKRKEKADERQDSHDTVAPVAMRTQPQADMEPIQKMKEEIEDLRKAIDSHRATDPEGKKPFILPKGKFASFLQPPATSTTSDTALKKDHKKGVPRGNYKCRLCGEMKINHTCKLLDNGVDEEVQTEGPSGRICKEEDFNFRIRLSSNDKILTVKNIWGSSCDSSFGKDTASNKEKVKEKKNDAAGYGLDDQVGEVVVSV